MSFSFSLFPLLSLRYCCKINIRLRSNWQAKSNFGCIHTGIGLVLISLLDGRNPIETDDGKSDT